MHPHQQPLNPEARKSIQQWLGETDGNTLRNLIRAKIILAKCEAVRQIVASVDDPQYTKDALNAAGEVAFYERVLHLLGSIHSGHNPDKPEEEFEYVEITAITDQPPLD